MKLHFNDVIFTASIADEENCIADYYLKCLKHLQHLPLKFFQTDLSFDNDKDSIISKIISVGDKLGIVVSEDSLNNQKYFNFLHEIYEKNAINHDFNDQWLEFHSLIHYLESYGNKHHYMKIDFGNKAALLYKNFDYDFMSYSISEVKPGDITIQWSELGKTPYRYWRDKEPDNLSRICSLAKPWINLKPSIKINFSEKSFEKDDMDEFIDWFDQYETPWKKHWNCPLWDAYSQLYPIKIGHIPGHNDMLNKLTSGHVPFKITL